MVVDGDLVPMSGVELVQNYARIPIVTGVARKEWAHKKRECLETTLALVLPRMTLVSSTVLQFTSEVHVDRRGVWRERVPHHRRLVS